VIVLNYSRLKLVSSRSYWKPYEHLYIYKPTQVRKLISLKVGPSPPPPPRGVVARLVRSSADGCVLQAAEARGIRAWYQSVETRGAQASANQKAEEDLARLGDVA
jgi:hypothetical protein